ncbi:MAG TPA: MSHA biogenesis protein MshJ, partial [Burkholderiaceae bacterium]|nr:MSHA biogenesis protein MshJ [Burkholderiaceae bacterium]
LMVVVILGAIVNTAILDKEYAQEHELSQQIAQDQSQIAGIQAEIRAKLLNYDSHPDAAKSMQLAQLQQKMLQMHASLQDMQKGLVSPDRMTTLLEDILKQNGKLRLVSLRTIPASGLNEPDTLGKADKNAAEKAAQKLIDSAGKSTQADGKDKASNAALRDVVYKHGVEIVVEGDYLDMVSYMNALEAMPWQLFWGKAKLTADDTAKRSLTLTLYTLSLDKKWLNI